MPRAMSPGSPSAPWRRSRSGSGAQSRRTALVGFEAARGLPLQPARGDGGGSKNSPDDPDGQAERPLLVGRPPPKPGAEGRMRIVVGKRARPPAGVLDAERSLLARSVDLYRDVHERAGPAVDEHAVAAVGANALDDRAPLDVSPLLRTRAETQAENLDRRRHAGRRGLSASVLFVFRRRLISVGLGGLDDDALCLSRVQERFLPLRIRVVVADDRVAVSSGALTGVVEARDRKRDVVDPRPALREEAVQESVGAGGLQDLEIAAPP